MFEPLLFPLPRKQMYFYFFNQSLHKLTWFFLLEIGGYPCPQPLSHNGDPYSLSHYNLHFFFNLCVKITTCFFREATTTLAAICHLTWHRRSWWRVCPLEKRFHRTSQMRVRPATTKSWSNETNEPLLPLANHRGTSAWSRSTLRSGTNCRLAHLRRHNVHCQGNCPQIYSALSCHTLTLYFFPVCVLHRAPDVQSMAPYRRDPSPPAPLQRSTPPKRG